MKRKTIARIVLLFVAIAILCSIYGIVRAIQGPTISFKDGFCYHRTYHFRFKMPANMTLVHASDKEAINILFRGHNPKRAATIASFLPTLSIDYEKALTSRNAVANQMQKDIRDLKDNTEFYRNFKIESQDIAKKEPYWEGRLVYTFVGITLPDPQRTEKRYLSRNNLIITFTYSDFDLGFNTKTLNEVISSLTFEKSK